MFALQRLVTSLVFSISFTAAFEILIPSNISKNVVLSFSAI